jgi:hypothetical protein
MAILCWAAKNSLRGTLPCQRPFIHYIHLLAKKTALGTNLEAVANGTEKFLELEFCFSL